MVKLKDGREVYGIIYLIRNKVNNKIYIGQTTRGFNRRYPCGGEGIERVHKYYLMNLKYDDGSVNMHLLKAIEKYGHDSFEINEEFDIAYNLKELNRLEYMYIKAYNSTSQKYGYNIKHGGDNHKHSSSSKVRDGVMIVCLNDNKIYRSYEEASKFYNVPWMYVKKTTMYRKFYQNNYTLLRFKKLKRQLDKSSERVCVCCGNIIKKKKPNSNIKYCKKCKSKATYKKDEEICLDGIPIHKVYYYKDTLSVHN